MHSGGRGRRVYRAGFRTARAMWRNAVSKNNKKY